MDRDAIVDRCESRFRDTSNAIYSAAEWADYVRDAEADVYAASPWWPFHENQASNTITSGGTLTLPSDAFRVTAVYNDTNDFPLVPIDGRSDYRYYFPDPGTNLGTPTHYRLQANELEVYPRPASDVDITIDYMVAPAVMSSGTAEPAFPEAYHRMLVSGALAYAYEDDGNMEQATIHRARFESLLTRMMDDLLQSRTERYSGIIDDFGF